MGTDRSGRRRQAADTSSAQHPTMRLASRPRPTRLPAHPGPDRTDGNAHARLRPTAAAPERPPAWFPSNVHAAVSGVHDGRHDRTGSGQRMPGRVRPDTVPSTGHASRTGSDADRGTDERHGRHSDILDRHDHKAARRDTPSPLLWGRRLRLGNQGRLRDGNTASATVTTAVTRQLLGVAPRSKPRLGALLSSDDYGSSVEPAEKLHPLWQGAWRGCCA
jgi:hypothetical protein